MLGRDVVKLLLVFVVWNNSFDFASKGPLYIDFFLLLIQVKFVALTVKKLFIPEYCILEGPPDVFTQLLKLKLILL